MNTAFFNLPDFIKIGIMAVLFMALVRFVSMKISAPSADQ